MADPLYDALVKNAGITKTVDAQGNPLLTNTAAPFVGPQNDETQPVYRDENGHVLSQDAMRLYTDQQLVKNGTMRGADPVAAAKEPFQTNFDAPLSPKDKDFVDSLIPADHSTSDAVADLLYKGFAGAGVVGAGALAAGIPWAGAGKLALDVATHPAVDTAVGAYRGYNKGALGVGPGVPGAVVGGLEGLAGAGLARGLGRVVSKYAPKAAEAFAGPSEAEMADIIKKERIPVGSLSPNQNISNSMTREWNSGKPMFNGVEQVPNPINITRPAANANTAAMDGLEKAVKSPAADDFGSKIDQEWADFVKKTHGKLDDYITSRRR